MDLEHNQNFELNFRIQFYRNDIHADLELQVENIFVTQSIYNACEIWLSSANGCHKISKLINLQWGVIFNSELRWQVIKLQLHKVNVTEYLAA